MKRLWKTVPPCMADVLGFEAVLNNTEGLGVIDDCGRYKPIGAGKMGGRGGPGGFGGGRGPGGPEAWEHRGHGDFGGRGPGGRGGRGGDIRVVNSEIRNADVITGTEQKVLEAFREGAAQHRPKFVLLCHAPSSSMIGSDLEGSAARIAEESGLPAAYVNADGGKDYLYGVSVTLEAMGKLLLTKRDTLPGAVNLLGCDPIGWAAETAASVEAWLAENGFTVLSRWGAKDTAENLQNAAAAERNLVVSTAGLRLARYMEAEFGVPYVAGAPFGKAQCERLLSALRGEALPSSAPSGEPAALVIGEQLAAGAVRAALRARGCADVRVLSFLDMDKAVMEPGDAKLNGEDELAAQLAAESVKLVFCDPDCAPLLKREGVSWINLPNPGSHSAFENVPAFDMTGDKLDFWLNEVLK